MSVDVYKWLDMYAEDAIFKLYSVIFDLEPDTFWLTWPVAKHAMILAVLSLTDEEIEVLNYSVIGGESVTVTSEKMQMTSSRIEWLRKSAFHKLQHPTRSRVLKAFLNAKGSRE